MTMTKGELELLHSHIDSSTHYLEFGSGESTIYASRSSRVQTIVSVESSQEYIDGNLKPNQDINTALSTGKLRFHRIDIGETVHWGYPKDKSKMHLWPNYSLSVFSEKKDFDLVLIDGRFRVACTLNTLLNTPDNCLIMIHDFWNRPEYHIVLKFLNIKERIDTLGIFTKKNNVNQQEIESLIKKYQYFPDDKTLLFRITNKANKLFRKYTEPGVEYLK
jgi:hypothetical protein